MDLNPHAKGFISEINVTPFVDVMLVLLVIFMVTAPMMTKGVDVDLPKTKTVRTLPQDNQTLVLSIKKGGEIFVDKYKLSRRELQGFIEKQPESRKKVVLLRADRDIPYGLVVQIMGDLKLAGIQRLGVVAESEKR